MGAGTRLLPTAHDGILLLRLESEDGLPYLTRSVLAQVQSETIRLQTDRGFQGCVITGTERAFAVGADIGDISRLTPAEAYDFSRYGQSVCRAIERSRVPIVAAIRGYCMGGGLDLALACHMRIATADAVFAHPGGSLGILTGWGGTQRLTRLIGRARASEIFAAARKLNAAEAMEFGLIRSVVPEKELLANARELSRRHVERSTC